MNHTIFLQTHDRSAVLERLLRVARHRGFEVKSLNMQPSMERGRLNITASVTSQRPVHLLLSQLIKLYDVTIVELIEDQALKVTC